MRFPNRTFCPLWFGILQFWKSQQNMNVEKEAWWVFGLNVCVCVFALNVCVCLCIISMHGSHKGQNRVPDPLELELQILLATMWVLGTKFLFSKYSYLLSHLSSLLAYHPSCQSVIFLYTIFARTLRKLQAIFSNDTSPCLLRNMK